MKHVRLDRRPDIHTVSTVFEALEKVDAILDQHGLEVVMWDDGMIFPYYSFSIVTREI